MKASRKESDIELPKWAIREIRALSSRTGIGFSKLRDAVLGLGIYNAKEQFGPTANLVESAIAMAKFTEEEPKTDELERPDNPFNAERSIDGEARLQEGSESRAPEPGPSSAEISGLPLDGYIRSDPSPAGFDHAGERRAEPAEIGPDSEFVASLSGE